MLRKVVAIEHIFNYLLSTKLILKRYDVHNFDSGQKLKFRIQCNKMPFCEKYWYIYKYELKYSKKTLLYM